MNSRIQQSLIDLQCFLKYFSDQIGGLKSEKKVQMLKIDSFFVIFFLMKWLHYFFTSQPIIKYQYKNEYNWHANNKMYVVCKKVKYFFVRSDQQVFSHSKQNQLQKAANFILSSYKKNNNQPNFFIIPRRQCPQQRNKKIY